MKQQINFVEQHYRKKIIEEKFQNMSIPTGLTFDDVLLVPNHSSISSRSDVSTKTNATQSISLNIPVISSNMDTVTEAEMAIAMAREGGLGIIHRFMSVEEQVTQVQKVKRSMSITIERPYHIPNSETLDEVWKMCSRYSISSLLVTDDDDKLVGILTARDILFEEDPRTKISQLMSTELITASPGIKISEAKAILKENRIEKLPLVDKFGKIKGLISTKDIEKNRMWPQATKDKKGRLRVGAAIGVKKDFLFRTEQLHRAECDTIVIDVAHGDSDLVINTITDIRKNFGDDIQLIAGNVATSQGASELISHGVDSIKVGVGPGSICITRVVAGAGVPQLTAIMETARIANDEKVPIIADGGIKTSGDISKAIAAGASTVMLGNLLAGTTEAPGVPILRNGKRVKIIRGMASLGASLGRDNRTHGSYDDEFVSDFVSEGVEAVVPFRGAVKDVLKQLVGGLRSGMSYSGASEITEMWSQAKFVRITNAGMRESKSHDVSTI